MSVCGGSFRDPSGHVFLSEGVIYRQINRSYRTEFDLLIESGLYEALTSSGLLVPHREVPGRQSDDLVYKTIQPDRVSFISYPYEWSFSQLKAAALATLEIQKVALAHGMSLKDASAYNVQFHLGKALLIDTLSFERYEEGTPWVAYRQFCQHFLAPLALMAYTDVRLNQWSRVQIDGMPLDLASALLPMRTWLKGSLLFHVHLHARSQRRYSGRRVGAKRHSLSLTALRRLIDHLHASVAALKWQPRGTEWADYYSFTNYSNTMLEQKRQAVADFLAKVAPATVWDLGANTGVFSRLASDSGAHTVAFDIDPAAVEKNYLESVSKQETRMLPLVMDLTNPSPAIGWNLRERASLVERGPVDMTLALALIHHLAISNNVPLNHIADFFAQITRALIIEFVPKGDSQVEKLLATRKDVFPEYHRAAFERAFARHFDVVDTIDIDGSQRALYLMTARTGSR